MALPAEWHYLIHPCSLDYIIAQASSDYIRAFHTRKEIGHGIRWREGKIFKCAAKGDLSRYSRVLNDPVVGEHFARYLGNEFEKCKKEVEYAALEFGDLVVLVDDFADRVLSAARSLQPGNDASRCRKTFVSAPLSAPSRSQRRAQTATEHPGTERGHLAHPRRGADRAPCRARHVRHVLDPLSLTREAGPFFTPITQMPSQRAGLLLGEDDVAVVAENDGQVTDRRGGCSKLLSLSRLARPDIDVPTPACSIERFRVWHLRAFQGVETRPTGYSHRQPTRVEFDRHCRRRSAFGLRCAPATAA